jgi:ribosomal protein S13
MPMIEKKQTILKELTSHYGIHNKTAFRICEELGISTNTMLEAIPINKKDAINAYITKLKKTEPGIDETLKQTQATNIERLIACATYRRKTA